MRWPFPPWASAIPRPRASAGELFRHELRWTRTIRALNPAGHLGSVVTFGFPIALMAALLLDFSWFSLAVLAIDLGGAAVSQVPH